MKIYIVQKGDSLWKIAKKFNCDFEELKKANAHLGNPDNIAPGMKIKVPIAGNSHKNDSTSQGSVKEKPFTVSNLVKEQPKELPKEQPIQEMVVEEIPSISKPVKSVENLKVPKIDMNNYYMVNLEVPKTEKTITKDKHVNKENATKVETEKPTTKNNVENKPTKDIGKLKSNIENIVKTTTKIKNTMENTIEHVLPKKKTANKENKESAKSNVENVENIENVKKQEMKKTNIQPVVEKEKPMKESPVAKELPKKESPSQVESETLKIKVSTPFGTDNNEANVLVGNKKEEIESYFLPNQPVHENGMKYDEEIVEKGKKLMVPNVINESNFANPNFISPVVEGNVSPVVKEQVAPMQYDPYLLQSNAMENMVNQLSPMNTVNPNQMNPSYASTPNMNNIPYPSNDTVMPNNYYGQTLQSQGWNSSPIQNAPNQGWYGNYQNPSNQMWNQQQVHGMPNQPMNMMPMKMGPNQPMNMEPMYTGPNQPMNMELMYTGPNQPMNMEPMYTGPNQPMNMEPMYTGPNQPMNMEPMYTGPNQPMNMEPMHTGPNQPMNMMPMNMGPNQPMNMMPMNMGPNQPMNMMPMNMAPNHPMNTMPMQMGPNNPFNMGHVNQAFPMNQNQMMPNQNYEPLPPNAMARYDDDDCGCSDAPVQTPIQPFIRSEAGKFAAPPYYQNMSNPTTQYAPPNAPQANPIFGMPISNLEE